MAEAKPVIGITAPGKKDFFLYLVLWLSVKLAGGKPLRISSTHNKFESADIQGLLLGGGKDIFPGRYNQSPKEDYQYNSERDEMEIYWAERARDEGIPTLGICRGAQLLNVVCGGTLHMSVAEAYEDAIYPDGILHNIFYRKNINVKKGTLLYEIVGRDRLRVNSIHKQAIAVLGDKIVVNATENNGVIQGISLENHPFYLGVQFHPEFLLHRAVFRGIFKSLVRAAKGRL
jgi:putative glutamine amidotransferase